MIGTVSILCGAYFACDATYMRFAHDAGWNWAGLARAAVFLLVGCALLRRAGALDGASPRINS